MLIPDDLLPKGYTEESWWPMLIRFSVIYNKLIDQKELFQLLQKKGINLEEQGHAKMTLVMWATADAFTNEIDYLLNKVSLNVNAKDDYRQTALFISVYRPPRVRFTQEDQERLCKVLLDHRALVNCVTKEGLSPIHLCSSASILKLLLSKGADLKTLTQTEEYQATLAEIAAERGYVAVLRRLYEINPTLVDDTNSNGRVPLLCKSIAEKEFDAFKFLLGVSNLDITTKDRYNVLDNAINTEQDIFIIRIIVEEFRKKHKSLD
jgi:ankyrin repeat protein